MTIVLDAMGSDKRPDPEVKGAIEAARLYNETIILVGDETVLKPRLIEQGVGTLPIMVAHTSQTIDMTDHIEEVRQKKDNSMAVGMQLVKEGKAQAFVTAGNTGMAMYYAKKIFNNIPGVIRPSLTAIFPVRGGHCVILDIGANAECRPEFLVQFAVLGSIYAEKMLGIKNPRIGLLANGEEAGKGNELVKQTYPLLSTAGLNFIGNVEGKEVFGGQVDVVVTDGFTGNVFLKASESVSKFMTELLKENLMKSFSTKMGALLAKPAFDQLKKTMDPAEVGAAPLLGIDGLVFVGHGRSDDRAIVSAIRGARQAVEANLLDSLRQAIQTRLSTSPEAKSSI